MTFLACGNGAPDIFSTLAALSQSRNRSGEQLGIQALFGKKFHLTSNTTDIRSFLWSSILYNVVTTMQMAVYVSCMQRISSEW